MKMLTQLVMVFLLCFKAANACECPPFTTAQEFCGSLAVAVGKIVDILDELPSSTGQDSFGPLRPVHYQPIEVFKGEIPEHALFITPVFDGECALPVRKDKLSLLFIQKNGVVSLCSASQATLPNNWHDLNIIKELMALREKSKLKSKALCKGVPPSIDLLIK